MYGVHPKPPRKTARAAARAHRELIAWQVSMELLAEMYRLASRLPAVERYGAGAQVRRAALSNPLNIAEGFGRRNRRDFARFLLIAKGSLRELQTLLEVIVLLEYVTTHDAGTAVNTANRVGFLLHRLRRSLRDAPRGP